MLRPKEAINVGDSFIAVIRDGPDAGKELGPFVCTRTRTKTGGPITDGTESNGRYFPWKQFELRKVNST